MKKIYWFIIGAALLAAFLFGRSACRSVPKTQTPYTVSLDHIKMMRQLHLTRVYFEQIIPIEKKDKLKSLVIVTATIDAYKDLDELKLESDSLNLKFTLPEVRLSEVNFILDSSRIYAFKHFGLYFSDNAYSEAIEDIQSGMRASRAEVIVKAKAQGIESMALKEAKDFITTGQIHFLKRI